MSHHVPGLRSAGRRTSLSVLFLLGLAACGGGGDDTAAPSSAGSSGGASSAGGASSSAGASGTGNTGGGAGKLNSGGAAGKAGTGAGGGPGGTGGSPSPGGSGGETAGGASGKGGGAPAGVGGTGGALGGSGGSGGIGVGGKGLGGTGVGGSGGGSAACTHAADCTAKLPPTTPPGCAAAICDAGTCVLTAKDQDGDGHTSSKCKAVDGTPVTIGDDCNDADATTFGGAWDGPKGDGNPDRCDGVDQDCNGAADDGSLKDGTTCTCTPGDVRNCSQDSGGKPINWPTGSPSGACKFGSQTCSIQGGWGPCTDAVPPDVEVCNGVDDDCNGVVDDGPPPDNVPADANYWAYDGDDDLHARMPGGGYDRVHACKQPETAPVACTSGSFSGCKMGVGADSCCPPSRWKLAKAIPADDCNDEDPETNPVAVEICDAELVDENCNGTPNEGCVCAPGSVDTQCSQLNGQTIMWPGGAPQGSCQYGSRTCAPDGKSWGQCTGTIAPLASDNCAFAGNDDTCDGVPNEGCNCTLGQTQPCGSSVGSCQLGQQSCDATGHYSGACVGATGPLGTDTCDAGNDATCNGVPNEGCAHLNGDACGAASTCNIGVYQSCTSSGTCDCTGGVPLQQVVYVKDGDGDGYCDLTGPQSVCPNAPGLPSAPWKPLSSCTSPTKTDCNDADPAVHPGAAEPCDGKDYNCDGNPNPACGCTQGQTASCWTGPAGVVFQSTFGPSICAQGTWTCDNTGHFGACTGQTLPQTESCNGKDDNCDGAVDDGFHIGDACDNGKPGSCHTTGTIQCNGATSSCNAASGPAVDAKFECVQVGGSDDHDCDALVTYQDVVTPVVNDGAATVLHSNATPPAAVCSAGVTKFPPNTCGTNKPPATYNPCFGAGLPNCKTTDFWVAAPCGLHQTKSSTGTVTDPSAVYPAGYQWNFPCSGPGICSPPKGVPVCDTLIALTECYPDGAGGCTVDNYGIQQACK